MNTPAQARILETTQQNMQVSMDLAKKCKDIKEYIEKHHDELFGRTLLVGWLEKKDMDELKALWKSRVLARITKLFQDVINIRTEEARLIAIDGFNDIMKEIGMPDAPSELLPHRPRTTPAKVPPIFKKPEPKPSTVTPSKNGALL